MDYFEQLIKSFPEALPEEEQKALLIEYYETGSEDARQKLLEHNLRLCLSTAEILHKKFNKKFSVDELFSMCYEELYKALDRYNPYNEAGATFRTFASECLKLKLLRPLSNKVADELKHTESIYKNDEEDEERDLIVNYPDESESHIPEDISEKAFIQDITNYIDTLKNGDILKMRLGLGYSHEYTQAEISEQIHISKQAISQKINDGLKKVQNYIRIKYSLSLPKYTLKPSEALKFNNDEERNRYLFESYYALNGKNEKSCQQLADEVYLNPSTVKYLVKTYKASLSSDETDSLSYNQTISRSRIRKYMEIFNDYYGQNGATKLSIPEIQQKYGFSAKSAAIPIGSICQKLINEGVYSAEDIEKIRQEQKELRDIQRKANWDKHAELYFSYYGINGYPRKSKIELYHDLRLSVNTITGYIHDYKRYLNSLSPEEREAEFAKYSKQATLE